MKRVVLISAAMLLTVAVIAVGVFVARHDWAVEELMAEIHVGPSSPYARINAQATAAAPEWEKLDVVLSPLGCTAAEAIERGLDTKEIWRAVCTVVEVPSRLR